MMNYVKPSTYLTKALESVISPKVLVVFFFFFSGKWCFRTIVWVSCQDSQDKEPVGCVCVCVCVCTRRHMLMRSHMYKDKEFVQTVMEAGKSLG